MFPLTAALLSSAVPGDAALQSTTDPLSQGIVAAIIVGVFVSLALETVHRVLVVIGAVSLMWAITYLTPFHLITFEGAQGALDLNVLVLLASMMAVVGVLKSTGVFEWAVARMLNRAHGNPFLILTLLTWFTAVLSAFADNVTTVIFVAPMALQMARAIRLNPVAFLLPVVMAANIGGTATLIGDPPNIMIGSGAGLSFLDFIVALSAPVTMMMFLLPWFSRLYFRESLESARLSAGDTVMDVPAIRDPVLLRWSLWISGAVMLGFFTHGFTGMPTAVPATIGAGALLIVQDVLYLRNRNPTEEERRHGLLRIIETEIEWPTLSFFGFLFIAVGAAVQTGLIDTLARGLGHVIVAGGNGMGLQGAGVLLFAALLIVWVSGIASAIVDNIPFVAVMIPILHRLTDQLPGETSVLWWALALGACLGGNGTVVGASANVTVIGIAERMGVHVSFREFTRFGAPVAAATLAISSLFIASYVYLGARPAMFAWVGLVGVVLVAKAAARTARARAETELASRAAIARVGKA
jgi:Na+/H+ antiporter NhaD/arsenite permease-like protein